MRAVFGVDVRERAVVDERRIRVAAAGLHDAVSLVGAGLVIDLLPAILRVCGIRGGGPIPCAVASLAREVVVECGVWRVGRGRPTRRGHGCEARARGEVVFIDGREPGRREGGDARAQRGCQHGCVSFGGFCRSLHRLTPSLQVYLRADKFSIAKRRQEVIAQENQKIGYSVHGGL